MTTLQLAPLSAATLPPFPNRIRSVHRVRNVGRWPTIAAVAAYDLAFRSERAAKEGGQRLSHGLPFDLDADRSVSLPSLSNASSVTLTSLLRAPVRDALQYEASWLNEPAVSSA